MCHRPVLTETCAADAFLPAVLEGRPFSLVDDPEQLGDLPDRETAPPSSAQLARNPASRLLSSWARGAGRSSAIQTPSLSPRHALCQRCLEGSRAPGSARQRQSLGLPVDTAQADAAPQPRSPPTTDAAEQSSHHPLEPSSVSRSSKRFPIADTGERSGSTSLYEQAGAARKQLCHASVRTRFPAGTIAEEPSVAGPVEEDLTAAAWANPTGRWCAAAPPDRPGPPPARRSMTDCGAPRNKLVVGRNYTHTR